MLILSFSIIQDCEDSLTNWVESSAAVSSKVSNRSRQLSQRRSQKLASGLDLSHQDQSVTGDRQSGLWVPASAHAGQYDDGEEEMEDEERGRQEEQVEA
jgi:hypothetical protein